MLLDDVAIANVADVEPSPAAQRPARPRVWTVFVAVVLALLAAVVLQALAGIALVIVEVARGGDPKHFAEQLPAKLATPEMFILLAACGQVAMGLAGVLPAWLSPTPFRERLGIAPVRVSRSVYPLATIGSLVPLAIGLGLAQGLTLVLPPDPWFERLFENIELADAVPFVLFIAIAPGIFEELLFRGYVQRRLLERWSPAWAIGVTSILFALIHVQPHTVVAVLPIGLWFGVVAWRSGSVLPGIFCHAFVNGSLNAWRMIVKFGELSEATQWAVVVASLVIGLICFVLALNCFIDDEQTAENSYGTSGVAGVTEPS